MNIAHVEVQKNANGQFMLTTGDMSKVRKYAMIASIYGNDDGGEEFELVGYEFVAWANNFEAACAKADSLEGTYYNEVDVVDTSICEIIGIGN